MTDARLTRRAIMAGAAGSVALAKSAAGAEETAKREQEPAVVPLSLQVNGKSLKLVVDPRTCLLDALREYADLNGTKKGCDRGACGACTVHLDGRRVVSCLTLAARCQGKAITTIEGLSNGEQLHPVQAAFIEHDSLQCGYCTPGQIMSAAALIKEGHAGTDAEIREWMSGNICRCGAYPNIVAAVRQAARQA
ncbi:MAG TPA: (2Fe-2S)-binding protein [Rhodopila sp.]|nr:(2Fe-2S)-binding protein [Rhodopila sp.]